MENIVIWTRGVMENLVIQTQGVMENLVILTQGVMKNLIIQTYKWNQLYQFPPSLPISGISSTNSLHPFL